MKSRKGAFRVEGISLWLGQRGDVRNSWNRQIKRTCSLRSLSQVRPVHVEPMLRTCSWGCELIFCLPLLLYFPSFYALLCVLGDWTLLDTLTELPCPLTSGLGLVLANRKHQRRLENMGIEGRVFIPWSASLLSGRLTKCCLMEGHSSLLGGHVLQVSLHLSLKGLGVVIAAVLLPVSGHFTSLCWSHSILPTPS